MIECRYCDRFFNQPPEKIGARCPKCRMPLFEAVPKRNSNRNDGRTNDAISGDCAVHAGTSAVALCTHCAKPMCTLCRTRWNHQPVCPSCVEKAIAGGEPTSGEELRQARHAWAGWFLAGASWLLLCLSVFPFMTLHHGDVSRHQITAVVLLFLLSFIPAIMALGESTAALRLRGPRPRIALVSFLMCTIYLGLTVGMVFLNVWMN